MTSDLAMTHHRADYAPPAYLVDHVTLRITLDAQRTLVHCTLRGRRHPSLDTHHPPYPPLVLQGEGLTLIEIQRDGKRLHDAEYRYDTQQLSVPMTNTSFTLDTTVVINPSLNTQLMGLYVSQENFFTQCEAEGFRRITFFPDRPDIMARYQVTLIASQKTCPVLLSNGNLVDHGLLPEGMHWARWDDPFPKPSYLFALVAGRLVCESQTITLQDGSKKLLQIWVAPQDREKTAHAMASLTRAIAWDERRFGLPLDLERFMIVAVSDFNMGAMENKGLNIFNTKYVLADPETATDSDYANIESVVGHEYFHNWTGNRVTCRDWFQLSLKEGLTVFRDQEFSMDMCSHYDADPAARAVCRIQDVRTLRNIQFPEDAGPMAHPVRPENYQQIDNFYTTTIYEKGAEVVRMLHTLLGRDGFRAGMDLYFQRHDGQAVTCDDFLAAMADANQRDLQQFSRWYAQSGTPRVIAQGHYDAAAQTYTLTLRQDCPATPGQDKKLPFHIPVRMGLLNSAVALTMPPTTLKTADTPRLHLPLRLVDEKAPGATTRILELRELEQTFCFAEIPSAPMPSLLREFSAPVILEYRYTDIELLALMAHDSDAFNRWEAGQQLAQRCIFGVSGDTERWVLACQKILRDPALDSAFKAVMLTLPSETYLAEQVDVIDAVALHEASQRLHHGLATQLWDDWHSTYHALNTIETYAPEARASGRRALKNLALSYLMHADAVAFTPLAQQQYNAANNMTDRFAALSVLVNSRAACRTKVLDDFAQRYAEQALVMDKWFVVQATRQAIEGLPAVQHDVQKLMQHPAFSLKNPNKVRSLVSAFCHNNPAQFHAPDGQGYVFWATQVLALDALNPQVAARLARALDPWRKHIPLQRQAMQQALQQVQAAKLSSATREVIETALRMSE